MHITYRTELEEPTPDEVFAWHERPGALERLLPPWADARVEERRGGIQDGGQVTLRVRWGPASLRWVLGHRGFERGRQFRDEQVEGPFERWTHTHRFLPRPGGGTIVEDDVDVELPFGAAGAALGPSTLRSELNRLFAFRHRRLRTDLARHAEDAASARLKVAITGASGFIGSNLASFLTTGGHRVLRGVRNREDVGDDAFFWDPSTGDIDREVLRTADAVVHLAGEPIAGGRWTNARKKAILQSRIDGTGLIARTLAELGNGPRVLVSMSGVNYYGDRGEERLDESSTTGRGFLAEVSRAWEAAVRPAERADLRVVRLRAGVVLSPAGGALGKMLLPFKVGLGGRLGTGRQYLSWIDLDDMVALIVHCLRTPSLSGPVNATSPNPVTNDTFTSALGRVLGRPTIVPVPAFAVKAIFGELGEEALLQGQRALPRKAGASGFRFFYEGVEESLRFQLGRAE
jgi:hypothetical protein